MSTAVVRPLRQASLNAKLGVNYSPNLALFRVELENIRSANPVLRLRVKDQFSRAKPDELRWRVITNTSSKTLPLSVQRNRLRRRWAAAFQQSLKKQGLAHTGKKETSHVHLMPHTPEIVGTLELVIYEGYGFELSPDELLSGTDHVVRALLRLGEGTKRLNPQSQFRPQDMRAQRRSRW